MNYLSAVKTFAAQSVFLTKSTFGRILRQLGMDMNQNGSLLTDDIAYLEPLNRHRNILWANDRKPILAPSVYIAPNATLFGSVYAAANVSFSFGSVAKAVTSPIRIGTNTSIGDNTLLDTSNISPEQAFPRSLNIGNNVVIQDNCTITSCIIDDGAHIGSRSVIKEGAQLERGCVIAPNSYVPIGSRIPQYTIWAGSPVRFVSKMSEQEIRNRQKALDSQDKQREKLKIQSDK